MREHKFSGSTTVTFGGEVNLIIRYKLQQHVTAGLLILEFLFNFLPTIFSFDWISNSAIQVINVIALFIILILNYTLLDFLRRFNFIKRRFPTERL